MNQPQLLLPDGRRARPEILGRYWCDEFMHCTKSDGDLAARLGCDTNELLAHEWQRWVDPASWPEIHRLGADIARRHGGWYDVAYVGKTGERFYTSVQSLVQTETGSGLITAVGVTWLEAWESPRTITILKAVIKCWWVPYVIQIGAVFL